VCPTVAGACLFSLDAVRVRCAERLDQGFLGWWFAIRRRAGFELGASIGGFHFLLSQAAPLCEGVDDIREAVPASAAFFIFMEDFDFCGSIGVGKDLIRLFAFVHNLFIACVLMAAGGACQGLSDLRKTVVFWLANEQGVHSARRANDLNGFSSFHGVSLEQIDFTGLAPF
jgi:hypothetical protein